MRYYLGEGEKSVASVRILSLFLVFLIGVCDIAGGATIRKRKVVRTASNSCNLGSCAVDFVATSADIAVVIRNEASDTAYVDNVFLVPTNVYEQRRAAVIFDVGPELDEQTQAGHCFTFDSTDLGVFPLSTDLDGDSDLDQWDLATSSGAFDTETEDGILLWGFPDEIAPGLQDYEDTRCIGLVAPSARFPDGGKTMTIVSGLIPGQAYTLTFMFRLRECFGATPAEFEVSLYDNADGLVLGSSLRPGWGSQWPGMGGNHVVVLGDYDGDGRTDPTIVDVGGIPGSTPGAWFIDVTTNDFSELPWGWMWPNWATTYMPTTGDFDGDGKSDRAILDYSSGAWLYTSSANGGVITQVPLAGPLPIPLSSDFVLAVEDYDNDGKDDAAIVNRPAGLWYVTLSSTGGVRGDMPWGIDPWLGTGNHVLVVGDYNGDGAADRATMDLSLDIGNTFVRPTPSGQGIGIPFIPWSSKMWENYTGWNVLFPEDGMWFPANADYDGDGDTDHAMVRYGAYSFSVHWYISSSQAFSDSGFWEAHIDTPPDPSIGLERVRPLVGGMYPDPIELVIGDYDGDGNADRGIVNRADSRWYVRLSGPRPYPLPSPPPLVAAASVQPLGPRAALMTATVTSNSPLGEAFFEFGTTAALGFTTRSEPATAGPAAEAVQALADGLLSGTQYFYRAVCENPETRTEGPILSFTTPSGEFASDGYSPFVLHGNGSLSSDDGDTPLTQGAVTYSSGVFDQALFLGTGNDLTYEAAGNIDETVGTIEFWIQPQWNGNDGQDHVLLRYGVDGGMLLQKDAANNWRLILNRFSAGGNPEVDVALNIGDWLAGRWYHAAFSWDANELRLYVDGQLRAQELIVPPLPTVSDGSFQIGADGPVKSIDAAVDELRISIIARSQHDIHQSYLLGVSERQFLIPGDLTEGNASEWGVAGQVALSDEASSHRVLSGQFSLKADIVDGFFNSLHYPGDQSAEWDLTNVQALSFSMFITTESGISNFGECNVRLLTDQGSHALQGSVLLGPAIGSIVDCPRWAHYDVPLAGSGDWALISAADLSRVRAVEIEIGAPIISKRAVDYTLFLDGVSFSQQVATPVGPLPTPGEPGVILSVRGPNPSTKTFQFDLDLQGAGDLSLEVFDVRGRRVRRIFQEYRQPGQYPFAWNGRDDRGLAVSSGVYVLRAQMGRWTASRRVSLIR